MSALVVGVLVLHVPIAAAAAYTGARHGRRALLVGALAPAAAVVWLAAHTSRAIDGGSVRARVGWVGELGLRLDLHVDAFATLMGWLVAGIGLLVFWFAYGYFDSSSPRLGTFAASLTLFAGAMLGLVFADDVYLLFLFWEATSVASFLLVGIKHTDDGSRASAVQAFLVTAGGGLALLGGLVLISLAAGSSSLSAWMADPPCGGGVSVGLVLVVIGAAAKSAQVPLHFWLPGAMAAPTPVSAYLHSATMVKAGVYLIARLSPGFATVGVWRPLVLTLGAVSMLFGGAVALRRNDLKQVLAYGTVSQLGFLVILVGAGIPELTTAGIAMLLAHALFKAALFMVVGVIDHSTGTRDLRRLGGSLRLLPGVAAVAAAAAASMAGVPPLFGFVTKEKSLAALLDAPLATRGLLAGAVVAGAALTAAYTYRAIVPLARRAGAAAPFDVHRPAPGFVAPAAILAAAGIAAGLVPALVNPLVRAAARAVDPGAGAKGLVLWPGINTALALSVLILAAGYVLFRAERAFGRVPHLPAGVRGEHLFARATTGLLKIAAAVTQAVQPGSLPRYLAVVALTLIALPGVALVLGGFRWPSAPVVADTPLQLAAALGIAGAALFATVVTHRLAAAIALGAVGFGVAVLFVVEGGPDLALTQLLVETIALVAFVLVLRHLPERYRTATARSRLERWRQRGRVLVSVAIGALVFAFAVTTSAVRTAPAVGDEALARSVPDGGGSNTVNVILSDFRALDTLGEITVLLVVTVAVMALVGAGRHRSAAPPRFARSGLLTTGVGLVFHTVVVFGMYLVFAGHNRPGGGFIAGLVVGAAFVVRYLALGELDPLLARVRPETIVGAGAALAVGAAMAPILSGAAPLDAASTSFELPLFGQAKLSAVLVFEFGVLVIVFGLIAAILVALGEAAADRARRQRPLA